MAKKKGARGRRGDGEGSEDRFDATSCASSSTMASLRDLEAPGPEEEELSPFERCIDALYEKRASTRERGLEGLCTLLGPVYNYEEAYERQDSLTSLLLRSVRYGGGGEAYLGARGLGLLATTLGAGDCSERLFGEARPVLEPASSTGKSPALRAAAAEALALLAFVGSEDPDVTDGVMRHLSGLWGAASPQVAAAALRGWSLLASTLPGGRLGAPFLEASLGALSAGLYSGAVEVREAAGQAIALLYDAAGLANLEGDSGDDEEAAAPSTPQQEEAPASAGGAQPKQARSPGMEEVVARMRDLATNRGDARRRSRRERAQLRIAFRGLCTAVEGGGSAESRVKLRHGDVLVVDSVAGKCQLDALRRFLGEGFQAHLQHNPLLHQVFDFEPRQERADRLTPLERRLTRSPASAASKSRTQSRNSARAATAAYKGAMMADAGD